MKTLTSYDHGIHAIDSGYGGERFDAIHLIEEGGRVAIVDTATNACVPRLLDQLDKMGIGRSQVDYVILTHIHLDHAGGAGRVMAALPEARLVVHPRGSRHMADPGKLFAAVQEVYGEEEADRLYGELLPVAAGRIIEAAHGSTLSLAGRELLFLDAPGHAKHHLVIRDGRSGHIFTGDTFGLSYRHFDAGGRQFVIPTTSPSQFDAAALHRTVDMIAGYQPAALYLTHYAQVVDVPRLTADLHRLIDAHVAVAERWRDAGGERHERIKSGLAELFLREARDQGWAMQGDAMLEFLAMDIDLNAQGLDIWLGS
ncbi:MBL fold metallo-hydrolase [Denitratisoma sp. DHT3]|uniref:MBL fold metallo-hydrolase n=1 Tax=Denitratisoma sp. DHT3 TaxID=1981880 RepID=UPI001198B7A6|nr:MBL fold metallo-hydrolase [Denitratisoma sp. DHT3]QDX80425.1 MBL fold metallo-hydrolase [Denitratisoma sp. DHT3]